MKYIRTYNESANETIRVSCAGLARVKIDGAYLFIINKNSIKVGRPKYGPLGGALEFNEESRSFLEGIGADFEKGMDLRITITQSNLDKYLNWFYRRKGRETSSTREIYEELALEENIVDMTMRDMSEVFIRSLSRDRISNRAGREGANTKSYFEIYEVELSDYVKDQILEYIALDEENPKVILVDAENIESDPRLAEHCKHVI